MIGQAETKNYKSGVKSSKRSLDHSVTRENDCGERGRFYIIVKNSSKVPSISKKIILQSP